MIAGAKRRSLSPRSDSGSLLRYPVPSRAVCRLRTENWSIFLQSSCTCGALSSTLNPWPCGESPRYRPVLNFGSVLVLELSSRVWVASICAHRRVRSRSRGIDSAASHARLSLPPPARSCDKTIGVRAHAPHDTSRTSAKGPCGRHRRSPLRPRSTHAPAMPSEATGGWPGLHPPCVSSRAYHRTHYSAPGHMQRTHACARIPMSTSATSRIRTQHLSHTLLV